LVLFGAFIPEASADVIVWCVPCVCNVCWFYLDDGTTQYAFELNWTFEDEGVDTVCASTCTSICQAGCSKLGQKATPPRAWYSSCTDNWPGLATCSPGPSPCYEGSCVEEVEGSSERRSIRNVTIDRGVRSTPPQPHTGPAYVWPTPDKYSASGEPVYILLEPFSVGCYSAGSLNFEGPVVSSASQCRQYCADLTYAYAGIEYGDQCFCGDNYNHTGQLNSTNCNQACSNASEPCGGNGVVSIYHSGYLGCFLEENNSEDLNYTAIYYSSSMTIGLCREACYNLNYEYAGLEGGNKCSCGNSFGSFGESPGSCEISCTGDCSENCGGNGYDSVFSTFLVAEYVGK